jgi:transposase-like protein
VAQAVNAIEVSEQTYYRWRREYGQMSKDQLKRLKELEKDNRRLKKLVAEQALDIDILKEVAEGNRLSHEIVGQARRESAGLFATCKRSWA